MILTILFIVFMCLAFTGAYPGAPFPAYSPLFLWLSVAILGFKILGGHL